MSAVLHIVTIWLAASIILGPALTWLFFYSERRARKMFSE